MNRKPKRYVPDLTLLSALGQANYARLQKLVREEEEGARITYRVSNGSHSGHRLSVKIEEVHRYTTMLKVVHGSTSPESGWHVPPVMKVRMYHDARMAEVIGFQNETVREGRYDYPNDKMHQPDEKTQLNQFLADWLEHCLKFGHLEQATFKDAYMTTAERNSRH